MGFSKKNNFKDPRGHSLRIYAEVFDSPAYKALEPHDVLAYLALLRELRGSNNGDLSLPLTRSKNCGIKHHVTLARSLRALCAVGLVAITRSGGCTRGGQRLVTLYRVTDRECYMIPAKFLEARPATNEWKKFKTVEDAVKAIEAAEAAVKKVGTEKKSQGHLMTATMSPDVLVEPKIRTPRDTWNSGLGHGVTMAEQAANPLSMRVPADFLPDAEIASPRTPDIPPLYNCHSTDKIRVADSVQGKPINQVICPATETRMGQLLRRVGYRYRSPLRACCVERLKHAS